MNYLENLVPLALRFRDTKNLYEKHAQAFIRGTEPMSDDNFWPTVKDLANRLGRFAPGSGAPTKSVASVITEFVRSHIFLRSFSETDSSGELWRW